MEFLNNLPFIGGVLGTIIPFIIVLGIVVFIHEYGHYIVAKWCGVKSDVFSIGFGPTLFGWHDKNGMHWKIAAIPLGGYVKFKGDLNPASAGDYDAISRMTDAERAESFHTSDLWRRVLIVAAGPFFNFILSIVIFAGLGMHFGALDDRPVAKDIVAASNADLAGLLPSDEIIEINGNETTKFTDIIALLNQEQRTDNQIVYLRDGKQKTTEISNILPALIESVAPSSAAEDAGLLIGDRIIGIDGEEVLGFQNLNAKVIRSSGTVQLNIIRAGETIEVAVTPQQMSRPHPDTGKMELLPTLGITNSTGLGIQPHTRSMGIFEAIGHGVERTWDILAQSINFIGDLISGNADAKQLGGPIGIAKVSGQAATIGLTSLLSLVALISASIGLLNLFPIPVLDGGHLVFFAIEAIRGKPLNEKIMEWSMGVGMSLVLMLMVFATYNDLIR